MNYDAVLFDVGGTLLNVVRDPRERVIGAIAHLGRVSIEAFAAGVERAQREWRSAGGVPEKEDLAATWVAHNKRALELAGFDGDVVSAARLMEESFLADGWELFADVHAALAEIRSLGLPMGVVSNWPATLESTLRQLKIRDYFGPVIASGVVGYTKPHPRIFHIALAELGVAAHRALYVGDSVPHDVQGAAAAGVDAVLLDRAGIFPSAPKRIRSLVELPALLVRRP